jgi:hypothetical protein
MRHAHKAAAIMVLLASCCFASDKNSRDLKLNLSWKGRAITLADKRLAHTFYFEDEVEAYQIQKAKLQSAREADGFMYFLFDVAGWSLGPSPVARGFCGSGEEKNLIWVKVDANWHLVEKQSVLYASCTQNIELHNEEEPSFANDALSFSVDDWNTKEVRKIEYSLKEPDKGLQVTTNGTLK